MEPMQPTDLGSMDDEPPARHGRPSLTRSVLLGVGGLAVGVAVMLGASAMTGGGSGSNASAGNQSSAGTTNDASNGGAGFRQFGGVAGTIESIDGAVLSVKTSDGSSVTVKTTGDTTVTDTVDGVVGDISAGDHLIVMADGTGSSDTEVAASRIVDNGTADLGFGRRGQNGEGRSEVVNGQNGGAFPGGAQNGGGFPGGNGQFTPPTIGTVDSVEGSTITLTTADGSSATVTTTSDTTVSVRKTLTVSDLAVGDEIVARSADASTGGSTVTATEITKGGLGGGFRRCGPGGGPGGGPFGGGGGQSGTTGQGSTTN